MGSVVCIVYTVVHVVSYDIIMNVIELGIYTLVFKLLMQVIHMLMLSTYLT